jgi:hypothetical protein
MANDTTTTQLFCCDCGQAEHFMFVDHYYWGPSPEYPPEFSMRVHLNHNRPLLKRLKTAALYLMGKKGKHGAFDSLILGTGDVKRLRASCDAFLVADWEAEKAQAAEVVASEGTFWSDETRAEAWQWLKDNETSPSLPLPNKNNQQT